MVDTKECFKAHPTLHALTGLGIGVLLAGLLGGTLVANGVVLGIILIVASVAGHYLVK